MGKHDFLTPKAIANRIKAKGLQKLRWFCQVCQKQCRDENGFKCHCMSESHKRQMEIFGQNPNKFINDYSREFEDDFMSLLKRAHPHSRVSANVVYNEYISDRYHVHMNSTRWLTLTGFVKYLGRTGKCKVEETPKGWFIQVIHKDDMNQIERDKKRERIKYEMKDDIREIQMIKKQLKRIEASSASNNNLENYEIDEDDNDDLSFNLDPESSRNINFSLSRERKDIKEEEEGYNLSFNDDQDENPDKKDKKESVMKIERPKSKLEIMMENEIARKALKEKQKQENIPQKNQNNSIPWICPGIIVKIMSEALKDHGYYKKKAKVTDIDSKNPFVAVLTLLEEGDIVKVDQAELETVLPCFGGTVEIIAGKYKGLKGQLVNIDTKQFQAEVLLKTGEKGVEEAKEWFAYEDICKIDNKKN